ncbi:MAG: alcohol dehydrogenase catalytic domain-containing protein [Pseudomonadota bacterium]
MTSQSIVLQAEHMPMSGIASPGPHQTYRHPRLSLQERELGTLNDHSIRIEMLYAGICGTDIHAVQTNPDTGYLRSSAPMHIPPEGRIIGHEGVGRIIEVGKHVSHVALNDYVTLESIVACHHCAMCRRGKFNQCLNAKLVGLEKDGIFGTVVDVPATLAHNINDIVEKNGDKGLRATACMEPAAVAYVGCENASIQGGDAIAVFGGGPIGLLSAMLSERVFGAAEVYLIEPLPFRREFAKQWCDKVYSVEEFLTEESLHVDVVIEASGFMDNVTKMFHRILPNGRVILLGRSGKPLMLDNIDHMITNEISVYGSRGHLCGAYDAILRLCRNEKLALDNIVTDVIDGVDALLKALNSPGDVIAKHCKVLARLNK